MAGPAGRAADRPVPAGDVRPAVRPRQGLLVGHPGRLPDPAGNDNERRLRNQIAVLAHPADRAPRAVPRPTADEGGTAESFRVRDGPHRPRPPGWADAVPGAAG